MSLPRDTYSEDSTATVPGVSISGDDATVARSAVLPPEDEDGGETAVAATSRDGDNGSEEDANDLEAEGALDEFFVYREGAVVPMDVSRILVDASVAVLPPRVFKGRHQLKEVVLPEGLREIGVDAFCDCVLLECIHCPSTLVRIGRQAFSFCASLKEVVFLEGLLEIGLWSFYGCKSLKEIKLPSTLITIGHGAFYSCSSLCDVVLLEGIQDIGSRAFSRCPSLERVTFPSSLRKIGCRAFEKCISLKEIKLREGLEEIGHSAFQGCIAMLRINIPSSVTEIRKAFSGCTSLKEVVFLEGLLEIGNDAFYNCKSLKEMELPSTLTTIRDGAFFRCTSLCSVVLPQGIQEIGISAFSRCASLGRVAFPSSLRKIGRRAFYFCTSLKEVALWEGLEKTGREAFSRCISLLRINMPSSITEIGRDAFHGCTLLINVAISSSLTRDILGEFTERDGDVFRKCIWLRHHTISSSWMDTRKILNTLDDAGVSLGVLINRFDGLPIHRMVYFYQRTRTDSLSQLKQQVTRHGRGALNCQDCLGMTPLHILACGGTPDIELYRFLIETCPGALTNEDRSGQTPLNYVLLGEAPLDVVNLLLDKHCAIWGQLPFDFGDAVQRLVEKGGTSGEFVRSVIRAQRNYFPDLEVDWGRIVDEASWVAIDYASPAARKICMRPYQALIEASVSTCTTCMSLEHKIEVDNRIDAMGRLGSREEVAEERSQLRQLITDHAKSYYLEKVTAILELALPDVGTNVLSGCVVSFL